MFRSSHLFLAILSTHRASIKPGSYFWDEIQFYADLIEVFLFWFNYETQSCSKASSTSSRFNQIRSNLAGRHEMTTFDILNSFSFFMASLAFLGAEQSMCLAFHALACFSHKETFHYANFTFGAEATFRSYRQSLLHFDDPHRHQMPRDYKSLFPELTYCRQEILAEMVNTGEAVSPSVCNHSRRNDSYMVEVTHLASSELNFFSSLLDEILQKQRDSEMLSFVIVAILFATALVYTVFLNLAWCLYFRWHKPRLKRKYKLARSHASSTRKTQREENNTLPTSLTQRSRPNHNSIEPPTSLPTRLKYDDDDRHHHHHQQHNHHHQQQQQPQQPQQQQQPHQSINFGALKVASV